MKTVNTVVYHRLEDEYLQQIAAVSPQINLHVGLPAHRLTDPKAQSASFPPEDIETLLPTTEVLFAFRLPDGLAQKAPGLRWVQFATAGVEQARDAGLFASDVIITSSSGIHAKPMGEYVLASMLMFVHKFPLAQRQQMAHTWKTYTGAELGDKTLGIVGYGRIGREVARLALAFGMKVVATQSSVTSPQRISVPGGAVELLPANHLHALLSRSDFVVVSVPLVQETVKLIGEPELRAMKPTAFLVNISRGRVLDEAALTRALSERWIAGAGLDVFEKEPLPADSPLWGMENVILTPHIAGSHERYNERATALFCENLRRYLSGQPLLNVVDKVKGY